MQGIHTPMSSFSHTHCRKLSGELDVLEATRYFSGVTEIPKTCRAIKTERTRSIEMHINEAKLQQEAQRNVDLKHPHTIKEKVIKCTQPCSPSAQLASFLNSFFQQYYSNSKKKKPSKLVKGEDECSSGRRKRNSTSFNIKSASSYYSSTSSSCSSKKKEGLIKDINDHEAWGDEFRLKVRLGDELNLKKEEEKVSDGGESDSSSNLFELKINYEFSEINSSELPVYENTHLGVIRRGWIC